jgi:hypothetical protein
MAIIDLSKDVDLPGCVEAPVFLRELMAANKELQQPVQTMLEILFELAMFTSKVSNPTLRILALRLGLFPMPKEELKKALETEMTRRAKQLEAKRVAKQEVSDGQPNPVANS